MKPPFSILGAALLLALIIAVKVSVWHECRTDHSVLYCLSLTSK